MSTIHGTWMRGGTSKCWLFSGAEADRFDASLDDVLIEAFGAEDRRQLDGVGGGTSTTSKAAIVRASAHPGTDVDYLFAQVAIGERRVEWGSNCGNCATAIGLYAVQHGLVTCGPDQTRVRMRNLNTGALLECVVDTPAGVVPDFGRAPVPGTAARGVPVRLTFAAPAGTATGTLLPTGSASDVIDGHQATLVDAGAPAALFDADGFAPADTIEDTLEELVRLRRYAAVAMGLAHPDDPISHAVPKVGIVSDAVDYLSSLGEPIAARDYDVRVSMVSMLAPHPAIGLTSAVAVACAARQPGSVVAAHLSTHTAPNLLRLGTPAGVVTVGLTKHDGEIAEVSLYRAARRLSEADIYIPYPTRDSSPTLVLASRSIR